MKEVRKGDTWSLFRLSSVRKLHHKKYQVTFPVTDYQKKQQQQAPEARARDKQRERESVCV